MRGTALLFGLVINFALFAQVSLGFVPFARVQLVQRQQKKSLFGTTDKDESDDPSEIVARRIIVAGDVQGGYYRSCVKNEAGRFRKLVGTMTPPDDSDEAEIYVEGKRKMVDGFIRWCKKADVGLSQVITVKEVSEESPTGLYDEFYVKIR